MGTFNVSLKTLTDRVSMEVVYTPRALDEISVEIAEVNRPGLFLAGYYDYFDKLRLQIMGLAEMNFLSGLTAEKRYEALEQLFRQQPPAVIVCRSEELKPFPEMQELAQKHAVALLRSNETTCTMMGSLISVLNLELAPRITRHGVLVEVYGEGILILGDSGIGKSEAALELIKRGHRLVSDDVVEIRKVSDETLVGSAPDITRHFIELRGIGIVDVKSMFGVQSVKETQTIDMVMTLEDMGFEIESSHHEKAPGQHEIDFRYAGAMETADRIVTFKTAVRSIAKRFGLYATFMPKPKAGTAGSGMHINISLFQNGKNIFSDPEAEDGLSQEAKWFMGGIMAHVKGMCAVTNPLVNSYKRLTSGCDAPRDIIWTTKNHNTLLRIPFMRGEDTRIELRFPDPSANAYLTIALCMAAGLDGIAKHLDPGAESARLFASRTEAEKAAAGIDHLPDTLREAVAFMEEDSFVKMVLGQEFVDLYVEAKKAEWNEYMSQVSEWEVDKYLYRT